MKFLAFLALVVIIASVCEGLFGSDSSSDTSTYTNCSDNNDDDDRLFEKVYEDGTWRVKGPLGCDHYYSDGKQSYTGFWGEEHRSNGEMVTQNGFVYDEKGNHIAYEVEDNLGITHRYDRN